MISKLHAVTDAAGRPLRMFLTAGQRSDYIGARALLDGFPPAEHILADRGYDADWYREALEDGGLRGVSFSERAARSRAPMTRRYTESAKRSRTASLGSRIGNASRHAITGAQRSFCQHALWPQCHVLVMSPDFK